jgi:hypothetical protein
MKLYGLVSIRGVIECSSVQPNAKKRNLLALNRPFGPKQTAPVQDRVYIHMNLVSSCVSDIYNNFLAVSTLCSCILLHTWYVYVFIYTITNTYTLCE